MTNFRTTPSRRRVVLTYKVYGQMRGSRLLTVLAALAVAAPAQVPDHKAPPVARLTARTTRVFPAPEASQGVAADRRHFYAIGNTTIAKYAIASGGRVGKWEGPRNGLIRHMNSCLADAGRLWCANSNYSLTPMASSVEMFDAATLRHAVTHSLGMLDEGSLTWFDRYQAGWIAG